MCCLRYEEEGEAPWTLPEVRGEIKERLLEHNTLTGIAARWRHAQRSEREEAYRTPITLSHFLRAIITNNAEYLEKGTVHPLTIVRFKGLVDHFMKGYYKHMRHLLDPMPFALLQVARVLNFAW